MTSNPTEPKDTIIDLDAAQVVEDVAKPDAQASVPPAKPRAGRSSWLLTGVALLAAAVAGGWLYRDVLSAYYPSNRTLALTEKIATLESGNAQLREQVSSLDKLVAQFKTDIDSLEAKGSTLTGLAETAQKSQLETADKIAALELSLAETKQALEAVAARPAAAAGAPAAPVDSAALTALQTRIDALEKDVASLKTKPAEPVDNTAALSQNLSDLKAKIAAGTGYRDELDRIARMVPAAPGLDELRQHAALGLPDAKGLAEELKKLIPDLPKPIVPGPVPESEGWWAGIFESLSDLITIRVEGDVDWPTAAAAASALAESGDLPQAIEQLSSVEGTKPAGIQQWLDRAAARLKVEASLQAVEEAVLRVIAAKG